LHENGIETAFVQGNVYQRNKALDAFKRKGATVRVLMLGLKTAASGSNLIEASHVILLDPVMGNKKEAQAVESQAIGRAYRQGQTRQVVVVRFMVKDSKEHKMYVKNYVEGETSTNNDNIVEDGKETEKPKLMRTSSIGTLLTTTPLLQKSKSFMELIEDGDPDLAI